MEKDLLFNIKLKKKQIPRCVSAVAMLVQLPIHAASLETNSVCFVMGLWIFFPCLSRRILLMLL